MMINAYNMIHLYDTGKAMTYHDVNDVQQVKHITLTPPGG